MKNRSLIPLLCAGLAALPSSSLAGLDAAPVRVDSTLTFALRITGEGPESERNNIYSNRFVTARMTPREVLELLSTVPRSPSNAEGEEGGTTSGPFPRGSRLVVTPNTGAWVVNRRGFIELDARPYVTVDVDRKSGVTVGTYNDNNGDAQETTKTFLTLTLNLPTGSTMSAEVSETDVIESNFTAVSGAAIERYTRRNSRRGTTEVASISATTSGTGDRPNHQVVAEGSVALRGRDVHEER